MQYEPLPVPGFSVWAGDKPFAGAEGSPSLQPRSDGSSGLTICHPKEGDMRAEQWKPQIIRDRSRNIILYV